MDVHAARSLLEQGARVTKYGRRGRPKQRFIFLQDGAMRWSDKKGKRVHKRSVPVGPGTKVHQGMNSKVFKRYEKSRRHLSDRCWSILAQGLSLDVTMDTSAQADTWIEAFTVLTAQRHEPNAGAGVGAGAGAGAVAGAGAGAGVGVGASNAPADRDGSVAVFVPLGSSHDGQHTGQQPPGPAGAPTRNLSGRALLRANSSRRSRRFSSLGDRKEAEFQPPHATTPLLAPSPKESPAVEFPTGISLWWTLMAALVMACQGTAVCWLGSRLPSHVVLLRAAVVAPLFGVAFLAHAVVAPLRPKAPGVRSALWLATMVVGAVSYVVGASLVSWALASSVSAVEDGWLKASVFQAVFASAVVVFAMQRSIRPCVAEDCVHEALELEASAIAVDVLDATVLLLVTETTTVAPAAVVVLARVIACFWSWVVLLRLVYTLLCHLPVRSVAWEVPFVGLDPLRMHLRVLGRVPGMGRNLHTFAALGFGPFRQHAEFHTTTYLGEDATNQLSDACNQLFWKEDRDTLFRHMLASWGPLHGDSTIACCVDNVRTLVAVRLRLILATCAAPADLAALCSRALLLAHAPRVDGATVWTTGVAMGLKNVARLVHAVPLALTWRAIGAAFEARAPVATAHDAHGGITVRPFFALLTLLSFVLVAGGSDYLLSLVEEASDAASDAAPGAVFTRDIPLSAYISADAAMFFFVLVAGALAAAAVCKCRCLGCLTRDAPSLQAARAVLVSLLVCAFVLLLQFVFKTMALFFALPWLVSNQAPTKAGLVADLAMVVWGVVLIGLGRLGNGVVRTLHPMRTLIRGSILVEVAMDVAGAASLFGLAHTFSIRHQLSSLAARLVLAGCIAEVGVAVVRLVFLVTVVAPVLNASTPPQIVRAKAVAGVVMLVLQLAVLVLRLWLVCGADTTLVGCHVVPALFVARGIVAVGQSCMAIVHGADASRGPGLRCCVPRLPRSFRHSESVSAVVKRMMNRHLEGGGEASTLMSLSDEASTMLSSAHGARPSAGPVATALGRVSGTGLVVG